MTFGEGENDAWTMNAMIDLQLRELNTMVIILATFSNQAQVDLVISFVI